MERRQLAVSPCMRRQRRKAMLAVDRPIETDGVSQMVGKLVNHVCSLSGIPARLIGIVIDGRSPGSRIRVGHLPSRDSRSGMAFRPKDDRQSAYSCGGSHGLGPFGVFRTVFPINPVEVILGEPSRPLMTRRLRPSRLTLAISGGDEWLPCLPQPEGAGSESENCEASFASQSQNRLAFRLRRARRKATYWWPLSIKPCGAFSRPALMSSTT